MTGARKEPVVFRNESLLVFPHPGANAFEAFRHPFRYAQ
jgi:hypothetical protein